MSTAVSMRGAAAGATVAIDFSKPVPVSVLADAAGIDPARIHGRARRDRFGLVDVAPPRLGGRMSWVTGESAKAFFESVAALNLALHPAPASK